ncbi:hypothetical protein [Atlantibacter hermannii]|uniref:hypothetical protein n=1 Tax=Atlantibacter hermannii TaxID=565 RepID=UPI0028AE9D13|nr:hypothetical protein [Atlantibacter hermannii]
MEESRKQFEYYAANKLGLPIQMIIEARKGDRYDHSFDSMNVMQPLTVWWTLWADSRAAIEIELPELEKWRSVEPVRAQITYRSMTKDRLIAAGLTVKVDR